MGRKKRSNNPPPRRFCSVTNFFMLAIILFLILILISNLHISGTYKDVTKNFDTESLQYLMKQGFLGSPSGSSGSSSSGNIELAGGNAVAAKNNENHGDTTSQVQLADNKQKVNVNAKHSLAGLSCDKYGGPSHEAAQEMVYWSDIPADNEHVSVFKKADQTQYLTFEPDQGGWNNIRMAMETVLAMAFAMGRTLVLPPENPMYLLGKDKHHKTGKDQRTHFSFNHFFHMESIHEEHTGLEIITMKQFLEREAMKGKYLDRQTGQVSFPPNNRTDWDGCTREERQRLFIWLRSVAHVADWNPDKCMAAFPKSTDPNDVKVLQGIYDMVTNQQGGFKSYEEYVGKPFPVDASPMDRMKENWAERDGLCIYDGKIQNSPLVHFQVDFRSESRLLVHFYAFLFFQDWKQDLWMKRFVRDHVRYIDEIQCAAARVVEGIRKRVKARQPSNVNGEFDTFHIRRGDFQYTVTRFEASKIYDISKDKLKHNDTVYIATDERFKEFFRPLKEKYDVVFLDDFHDELKDVNSNYYGMIDQLVASRGRTFFGCWFSTFTGYINRLRGYHANNEKAMGYEQGIINSWYYALHDRYDHMQVFYPVKKQFYAREFPTSWRLIDTDIE